MAKTKRAKAQALKARRAVAKKAAAGGAGAKPKRRYVTDEMLADALERERELDGHVTRRETCGFKKYDPRIVHPRRTRLVTVEMRTGSGTTQRTIERSMAFRESAGVIRQSAAICNPAVYRCTDAFYARIDHDLAKWRQEEDLKLKVPYAVKDYRRRRIERALVRKHAIERGLV